MRGIANPIYSFRVSRVRIPPFPPMKKWLMLVPYEGSIGDNTYKLKAVGGRASMII